MMMLISVSCVEKNECRGGFKELVSSPLISLEFTSFAGSTMFPVYRVWSWLMNLLL
jgi:hypothetical protein